MSPAQRRHFFEFGFRSSAALAAPSTFTPSRTSATTARHAARSWQSRIWLLWVAVDCCFGLALVRCSHSMDLQPAGMIFRRAAILSPLSHTRRRLPQALAAQRLHGQMVDPNSRAAGAESSRSMVPASVVRVDVPAGSISHAHAPQSDRTAHSACATFQLPLDETSPVTAAHSHRHQSPRRRQARTGLQLQSDSSQLSRVTRTPISPTHERWMCAQ